MTKKGTKKGNNNWLIFGGIGLAALYIISKQRGESPAETIQNIIPSGETGSSLTENLFGGTSPVLDFSGMFEGLNLGGGGGGLLGGGGLDLGGLGLGGDGNLGFPDLPDFDFGGGGGGFDNSIPTILGSVGDLARDLAGAGLTGAATYLGFKALSPVAPAVGRTLAGGVTNVGRAFGSVFRGSTGIIPSAGAYLTTPVNALGVAGTLGAIPLVAGAAYGGYKVGEALVEHTPVGKIVDYSGSAGAWASRNVGSVPVVGGTIEHLLGWEHAEVVENKTIDYARKAAKLGLTGGQAALWIAEQRGQ